MRLLTDENDASTLVQPGKTKKVKNRDILQEVNLNTRFKKQRLSEDLKDYESSQRYLDKDTLYPIESSIIDKVNEVSDISDLLDKENHYTSDDEPKLKNVKEGDEKRVYNESKKSSNVATGVYLQRNEKVKAPYSGFDVLREHDIEQTSQTSSKTHVLTDTGPSSKHITTPQKYLKNNNYTNSNKENNEIKRNNDVNDINDDEMIHTPAQFDSHNTPESIHLSPKWNKAIFNELQSIMSKYLHTDDDDEDTLDITMVTEYAPEIFNYLHELENKLLPNPNYMSTQDELKWEMRAVLIDWVVQVHSRFNLLPETLFLTINYIDRFLSKRKVSLSRFQLVGAVALFIAAKYEEINCPTIQEVAFMADNAYSIDEFLKAERFMIDVLEFDMGWPGPMSFLRRTSKADDYDFESRTLAKYFLEITIMDSKFVSSPPSWLAAGSHYLARKILNKGKWTELHVFYSGYTESQLIPLAEILLSNCKVAKTNHKAIYEKYQDRRYRRSSLFVQEYFELLSQSD